MTLRGIPVTMATITPIDVAGVRLEAVKCSHQREELQQECQAIQEAADVQVSGTMTNSGSREGCGLLVLVDHWTPITEEADATA